MSDLKKALIIGGGPTGLAAALLLKQENHITPLVYEACTEPTTIGGAIGIPANGLRLFKHLGVYDELMARGSSGANIVIHSLRGSVIGQLDMVSWTRENTGFGQLEIQRVDLMEVLCAAAKRAGIEVHYNKTLVGLKEKNEQVVAGFSDGTTDTADFLLGCDGRLSSVRKLHVDPDIQPEYSGITDIYCLVPTSDRPTPADLLREDTHATFTSDGIFVHICCTESRDVNYWFFSSDFPAPDSSGPGGGILNDPKPIIRKAANNIKAEWGDVVRDFVDKGKELTVRPIYTIPLGGVWYKGRCLLLGDAAHAMSPHANQGVSMALEDVFFLSRLLDQPSLHLIDIFKKFDEKRRPRVQEIYNTSKRNGVKRKRTGPWRLWFNELATMAFFTVYRLFNMQKLGVGLEREIMSYDVREESI